MSNDANEYPKILLNVDLNAKIVNESDLCANVRFFALMNVSSRCLSPFHSNECVFSRNEQQKVYSKTYMLISYLIHLTGFTLFRATSLRRA